jgi:hypothetical protein
MAFTAKEISPEDPRRTGWDEAAGTPAAASAPPAAELDAAAGTDMDDARAAADATSPGDKVAYAPPSPDAGAPANSGSPIAPGHAMDSSTPADALPSVDTGSSQRWNQIQATFVDDPRGSVVQAATMADEAIEAFISAARERQAWLASSWQGPEAGTEELRTALQDYRALYSSMTEIAQSALSRGPWAALRFSL